MAQPNSPPRAPIQEAAALHRAGRLAEAAALYQKILKKNPRDPDALHLLGLVLTQQGDLRSGLDWISKALKTRDDFPDAHSNAAQIAGRLGNFDLAVHHARKAAVYHPNAITYTTLARLLRTLGRYDEALTAFRAAHECNPRDIEGCISYARGLRITHDAEAMLAVAETGLRLAPEHPTLRLLASEAFFAMGRLAAGWRAYQYRFRSLENRIPPKVYTCPAWQGENLGGKSLLIWAEQGPGDEIMYANMYGDAIARAERCFIQCTPRLAPLMRRSFPSAVIFDRDLSTEELAAIDYQTPAGSMGEWLRTSREDFPQSASYLKADADLRDSLRARYLAENSDHRLVGIAWRSANANNAVEKSTSLLNWGPILKVPGVTFVNLQYGDTTEEMGEASRGFGVPILHDASIDPLKDMDAYAAQVAAMDLVVSSSNTAAHVAGALGVPTVCMLPASLDCGRRWYWLPDQNRTPWYPSMQLLTQREPYEWLDVLRDAGLLTLEASSAGRDIAVASYYRTMIAGFLSIKRPDDAEAVCAHMTRTPELAAEAYLKIAEMRKTALDADGVFAACDKAIAADPTYWPAYNLKGVTLADLHRFAEAITVFGQGLEHNARSHLLHSNLGRAHHNLGRYAEALHHTRLALEHVPTEKASAVDGISVNYASALYDSGQAEEALHTIEAVIDRSPENVDAHYNRGLFLLAGERWKEGWLEYRWRLKRPNTAVIHDLFSHITPWKGEPLTGKKVLIWMEHGIGDEILASTMLPDAIASAKKVVILCADRLAPLFRRSFPSATVDILAKPLPRAAMASDFDFQVPVWDLGIAFRKEPGDFPSRQRTLIPDSHRTMALRKRYANLKPGNVVVGISWASMLNQEMGWLKANQLQWWRPILQIPGVTFVNLQYGDHTAAVAQVRDQFNVDIFDDTSIDPLKDMDAFAAQVAAVDLVISTSNTLAHTAGAVGTPAWVLTAKGRGLIWYWLRHRTDSPWYSSLRLIRQNTPGDWTHPIARCADDLKQLVQEKKAIGMS